MNKTLNKHVNTFTNVIELLLAYLLVFKARFLCVDLVNALALYLFICLFFKTGFLCVALAVLELNSVDQAGLKLRNPPASASQMLGLKARQYLPFFTSLLF